MNGFKFGWMKKTPSNLQGKSVLPVSTFEDDSLQSDDEKVASSGDWRVLLKNAKSKKSESSNEKFSRLYDEGASLAEEGRYWEAINRWDEALQIKSTSPKVHEMKSQVLMELAEIYPAVESAKRAIHLKPDWAEGYQTLGRSMLNTGQLILALKCFMKGEFLAPNSPELWADDAKWTLCLIEQEKQMMEIDDV